MRIENAGSVTQFGDGFFVYPPCGEQVLDYRM